MPPILYLIRHAQGFHNVDRDHTIRDATLTELGKAQCEVLRRNFEHQDSVNLVLASPLRRAVQTAAIGLAPAIARPGVPFKITPMAQEVTDFACDTGIDRPELIASITELFKDGRLESTLEKIDWSEVGEVWHAKTGIYSAEETVIKRRAAELRKWLYQRPEEKIAMVTHGAFLHFLTEDWTGDDPNKGTAYNNCECREFVFTESSSAEDAHIIETEESQKKRGPSHAEDDPIVLDDMDAVSEKGDH